jgi:hypothetical protein
MLDLDALVSILTAVKLALDLLDRLRRRRSQQRRGNADNLR